MERLQLNTLEEMGDFINNNPEDYAFLSTILDEENRRTTRRSRGISASDVEELIRDGNLNGNKTTS
jgi:hypothetical protein